MNPFRGTRTERMDRLISLGIIVGILLATVAVVVLLVGLFDLLREFRREIFLFVTGAILAYLLAPLARGIQRIVRQRWIAILFSYLLILLALLTFGLVLINPFISQARSLQQNLVTPAASSLHAFAIFQQEANTAQIVVNRQQSDATAGTVPDSATTSATDARIAMLQRDLQALQSGTPARGQLKIPPSYLKSIAKPLARLPGEYARAFPGGGAVVLSQLAAAKVDATAVAKAAATGYAKAVSTPILLLNLQVWLDQHNIALDLKDKFGQALQELSKQLANIVNNALGIALQAGNLLLNTVLILLISIYFLSDGARFVRWLVNLSPAANRPRVEYFVRSLDSILGKYLRTQVVLALLAATLDATGAIVLGVPYAAVIFLSSFFLSLVPVIGPVVLPIPPILIALIFTPLPKPLIFAIWLLVGEQITTNVIGPRLQGHRLGIHPLEAMAAALIGFPVAGILGSFLAIPLVAFLHVVIRSLGQTRQEPPQPLPLPRGPDPPAPAA